MLKALDENFLDFVALILNNIFDSGSFPQEWALGIIVILFEEGSESDLNNYRGITLLSMLGKILVVTVNNFEIIRGNQAVSEKATELLTISLH